MSAFSRSVNAFSDYIVSLSFDGSRLAITVNDADEDSYDLRLFVQDLSGFCRFEVVGDICYVSFDSDMQALAALVYFGILGGFADADEIEATLPSSLFVD